MYIQACGLDLFCDAAFIYDGMVRNAGGVTKLDAYPGLPHGFWGAYPLHSATARWLEDIVDGVAWLLKARRSRTAAKL